LLAEDGSDPFAGALADSAFDAGSAAGPQAQAAFDEDATDDLTEGLDEQVKVIGDLRIGIPLYNVYLNEADEWSLTRQCATRRSAWRTPWRAVRLPLAS
jgi:chemosensory pili system protein ChpA (sensor histidine kinase/response regulator)